MKWVKGTYTKNKYTYIPDYFPIRPGGAIASCCGSKLVGTVKNFYASAKGITVFEGDCITGYTGPKKNHTEYQLVELPDGQKLSFAFRTTWNNKKDV